MPRWVHSIAFGLVVALAGVALLISPPGRTLERSFGLTWLFQLRGPIERPHDVAVVGIDGGSGRKMGFSKFPRDWPRTVHAAVLERAVAADVTGVVFDFDFSRSRNEEHERSLADAIRASGRTILFERLEGRRERLVTATGKGTWVWREEATGPVPVLAEAARASAPFPLPKIEKSSFQFWAFKPSLDDAPTTSALAVQLMLLPYQDLWNAALKAAGGAIPDASDAPQALQAPGTLRPYMQTLRKQFRNDLGLAERVVEAAAAEGPQDYELRAIETLAALYSGPDERFTNYYGPPGTILTVPFHDMVKADRQVAAATGQIGVEPGEFDQLLSGRMVFVGYSDLYEPDQPDRFYTVFTSDQGIDLSGVEIMATAFANLLAGNDVKPLEATLALAATAIFGFVLAQLVFWPPAVVAVPLALAAAGAYGWGALNVFSTQAVWAPMVAPIALQLPLAIVAGLFGQYLLERRQKLRVGRAMAQYIPESVVRDLTAGRLGPDSFNRVVHGVCLATDMSGFSTISENKTPEQLAEFVNAYFEAIAQVLKVCKVDVTEFHADTIVCAWLGEPDDEVIRRQAVDAALAVIDVIDRFSENDPDVSLTGRVGLQEGAFYLGHTGGGGRMTYSILGDPANGAARLEGLNKRFGTHVLAAESVASSADGVALRRLGDFRVVGKAEVIPVIEVVCRDDELTEEIKELLGGFETALELFQAMEWQQAAAAFDALAERFPDDIPSRFYAERCHAYADGGAPEEMPTLVEMTEK